MHNYSVSALTMLGFRNGGPGDAMPVSWSDGWQVRYDGWGSAYAAFASQPESWCMFKALTGQAFLEVVATAWSGMLELSTPGESRVIDLYSPEHSLRRIAMPGDGQRDVCVRLLDDTNSLSSDKQIWLRGISLEVRPHWMERGLLLNDAVSLVDADEGRFIIMERDNAISYWIKYGGVWGAQQVVQFKNLVAPGTNVIDIGANLGHHTVVLSKIVGRSGSVIAFEPQPKVQRVLQANLLLNQCDNVTPYELALGDSEMTARMFPLDYDTQDWNVGSLPVTTRQAHRPADEGIDVKIVRLDSIVGGKRIDFIKSDAQGFDFAALRGGVELLKACKPMILTEIAPNSIAEAGEDYRDYYTFLQSLGYRFADPDVLDFTAPPRQWSGRIDEEWDLLAVHPSRADHLARIDSARGTQGLR